MANKRMFSTVIVGSDTFLDMPPSTRELYFQLGMYVDDDGFVSPKKIMRMTGAGEDDLKILIAKRFVLVFESNVLVIKHHRINNNWDAHNCRRTVYLPELSHLYIKQNKAYTLDKTQGVPVQSDFSLISDVKQSLEENRIDKNRREEIEQVAIAPTKNVKFQKPTLEEVQSYCSERKNGVRPEKFMAYYESNGWRVGKNPMKDWKACVRTWENSEYVKQTTKPVNVLDSGNQNKYVDFIKNKSKKNMPE